MDKMIDLLENPIVWLLLLHGLSQMDAFLFYLVAYTQYDDGLWVQDHLGYVWLSDS